MSDEETPMGASADDGQAGRVSRAVWHWRTEGRTDAAPRPVWPRLVRMVVIMALVCAFAAWRRHWGVVWFLGCFAGANVVTALALPAAFRWHARLWERLEPWRSCRNLMR